MKKLIFILSNLITGLVVVGLTSLASGDTAQLVQILTSANATVKYCDHHTFYDASDNGSIKVVSGVSGKKTYVCGYILGVGGTATNLNLAEGTGSNCGSSNVQLTPAWQLAANSTTGADTSTWNGFSTAVAGDDLCVNASAGNSHQLEIWYSTL